LLEALRKQPRLCTRSMCSECGPARKLAVKPPERHLPFVGKPASRKMTMNVEQFRNLSGFTCGNATMKRRSEKPAEAADQKAGGEQGRNKYPSGRGLS